MGYLGNKPNKNPHISTYSNETDIGGVILPYLFYILSFVSNIVLTLCIWTYEKISLHFA